VIVHAVMSAVARKVEAAKYRPNDRRRRMSQLHSGLSRDEIFEVELAPDDDHQLNVIIEAGHRDMAPPAQMVDDGPPDIDTVVEAAPKLDHSAPTSSVASACECRYDQDDFSDSASHSDTESFNIIEPPNYN